MSTQPKNYQCPTCMGPLHFHAQSGALQCDYCGSQFSVADIEARYAKGLQKDAPEYSKSTTGNVEPPPSPSNENAAQQTPGTWNEGNLHSDWGGEGAHIRVYSCPSCAAEILCDETTAATSCLYCGNPTVMQSQFAGALRPNFVLPFEQDKQAATQALKKHCEKKLLLPKLFKQESHIEEIKGVYVPFWLFDGTAHADVCYHTTQSSVRRVGDYNVTTTHHYNVRRAGAVRFQDIPVDASSKMPDDYMESIEPFDYTKLRPFQTAYLPGFFADKYDVTVDMCANRADERAENSAVEIMRNSVTGYSSCIETKRETDLHRGDVQYAMVPVWLLSTKWNGKDYLFAMNGQTGKFVGDLPCDKRRFWALCAAATAAFTALISFVWFVLF